MQKCQDSYNTTFGSYSEMLEYHKEQESNSQWTRCKVRELLVEPLDATSALRGDMSAFASGTSAEAVEDTVANLGLAIRAEGELYPVRTTAYKSLLDRAKIGGSALPKLSRNILAATLNACLQLYGSDALVLIRDEKVAAVHSGDEADYSVLPIDELLSTLKIKLDDRFPKNEFKNGYADHCISSAAWVMPNQKDDLIGTYTSMLAAQGKTKLSKNIQPGIRFVTSDVGLASAKVSALLMGGQYPIHIGSCVSVDHRHQSKIADFSVAIDQLYAQFGDSITKLKKLLEIQLDFPVNAMTRVCKKLSMPKKAAIEAIAMFEMAYGGTATAHDVFMGMQEIMFTLKSEGVSESKLLSVEENMARALTLNWRDYDLAKAVEY